MLKYWRKVVGIGLCVTAWSVLAADCEEAVSFVEGYYENLNNNKAKEVLDKWLDPQNPKKLRESVANVEYARLEQTKLKSCANGKASVYVEVVVKSKKQDAERWKGRIKLSNSDDEWKIDSMDGLKKVPGKVAEPGC